MGMTRAVVLALVAVLAIGCGKSADERLKEDMEKEHARHVDEPKPTPEPTPRALPDAQVKPDAAAEPEPTTPEEIDNARKKAMIDGRDKDVIKYCEMGKYADKPDPQIMLGCTLAACRVMDADKAKEWAKGVVSSKPLYDQAIKTCMANKVVL